MSAVAILSAAPARLGSRPAEATEIRTQLISLGVEESRSRMSIPPCLRPLLAFEQRWFGGKSLAKRYDAFPEALEVLRR